MLSILFIIGSKILLVSSGHWLGMCISHASILFARLHLRKISSVNYKDKETRHFTLGFTHFVILVRLLNFSLLQFLSQETG